MFDDSIVENPMSQKEGYANGSNYIIIVRT